MAKRPTSEDRDEEVTDTIQDPQEQPLEDQPQDRPIQDQPMVEVQQSVREGEPIPPILPVERGQTSQTYDGETDPAQVIKARNIQRVREQHGLTGSAPQPPTITRLEPSESAAGAPDDFILHVYGTAFAPDTMIVFNDHIEPTTLLTDTEATTIVKPSLFVVAAVCPVIMRNATGDSNAMDFTFTEPLGRRADSRTEEEIDHDKAKKAKDDKDDDDDKHKGKEHRNWKR